MRKFSKLLSYSLSAAIVAGMMPVTALADDVTYKAGTYAETVTVNPNEDEDFDAYDLTVNRFEL